MAGKKPPCWLQCRNRVGDHAEKFHPPRLWGECAELKVLLRPRPEGGQIGLEGKLASPGAHADVQHVSYFQVELVSEADPVRVPLCGDGFLQLGSCGGTMPHELLHASPFILIGL